jgi:hypothetical protein
VDKAEVTLRVVEAGNRPEVERLRVASDQENFVDGVARRSRKRPPSRTAGRGTGRCTPVRIRWAL